MSRHRLVSASVASAATLLLAACGGSIWLGYDDFDDEPPNVSLAASPGSAAPGQSVHLVAAASDDFGVDQVRFFRLDAGGASSLGVDGAPPFQWDTVVPAGASGSVQFFARATDGAGQERDSAVVAVTVTP
jgi:hypothetical protein